MASMRSIGVRLRLEAGDYKREAGEAEKATRGIGRSGVAARANLDKLAFGLGVAGAAMTGFAALSVGAAMKFDKQMSEVGAVSGATADEMQKLRQAALDAGAATVFSATEAAEAETELAKAGIDTAQILSGALTGALSLASAGSLTLADAATIAAAAMNTFNLSGRDVEHIADVLASAANKSAAGVDDLGLGLQQVGLVAAQNKLTLEDTVGVLAALADRGLRGSDAGTSLKTALQRLSAPTAGAKKVMDELGVSLYDANGNMNEISTVAGQLQRALKDLAPAQRNAALQTIFGSDAIRAGNVLYAEGEAGIRDYIAAVNDNGAAARVAEAKLDNLSGDVEELTGSLETLFISSGSGANSGLRVLAQSATELVNTFGSLPGPVQSGVVAIAGIAGTGLLATAGIIKLRSGIADMVESMSNVGPMSAKAGRGLQAIAAFAGRTALALGAVAVGGRLISGAFGEDVNANVSALAKGLAEFGKNGEAAGEAARLFGTDLENLNYDLAILGSGGLNKFGVAFAETMEAIGGEGPGALSVGKARERLAALDAALTELVNSGHADAANAAFKQLWEQAQLAGISLDDLRNGFPGYISAAGEAAEATLATSASAEDLNRAQLTAVKSGEKLIDVWERMHGATMSADEAMLAAIEATNALKDAFKENGKAIDGNSEGAIKNRLALDEQSKAAYAAADAYLANGGSAEGAQKILDEYKKKAYDAAVAAGANKDQVKKLNDELYRMPPAVSSKVTVTYTTLYQSFRAGERGDRWGNVYEHAAAGTLRDAAMYTTANPGRYMIAEPETGGEAFVPKRGNYKRSLGILQQAAGWYGASVQPGGGAGGGWGAMQQTINLDVRLVDPITGATTRRQLITDATNRNVPSGDIKAAYP